MSTDEKIELLQNGFTSLSEGLKDLARELWRDVDPTNIASLSRAVEFQKQLVNGLQEFDEVSGRLVQLLNSNGKAFPALESLPPVIERNRHQPKRGFALEMDFKGTRPSAIEIEGEVISDISSWRELQEVACNFCARRNPALFRTVPDHPDFHTSHGTRYFTRDSTGHRSPLKLDQGIWVESHLGSNAISELIRKLLKLFGIREKDVRVFLREVDDQAADDPHRSRNDIEDDSLAPGSFRRSCLVRIEEHLGLSFAKQNATLYESTDHTTNLLISVSKDYGDDKMVRFWYTLAAPQIEALDSSPNGWLAFGCGTPDNLLLIPHRYATEWLRRIRVDSIDGPSRWDVKLSSPGDGYRLLPPYSGREIKLKRFLI
jgi:hypothetical protein